MTAARAFGPHPDVVVGSVAFDARGFARQRAGFGSPPKQRGQHASLQSHIAGSSFNECGARLWSGIRDPVEYECADLRVR